MILIAQLNVSNIYMSFEYYLLKSSMPLTELKEINIYIYLTYITHYWFELEPMVVWKKRIA